VSLTAVRVEEYFDTFTPDGDAVRVRVARTDGRVTWFVVQYEIFLVDRWRPVVRDDSAHGRPHRDVLDWEGRVVDTQWFPADVGNAAAFTIARDQIRRQWRSFRDGFTRRKP
jgi:hypothetical protein